MSKKQRIDVSGGGELSQNPFGGLDGGKFDTDQPRGDDQKPAPARRRGSQSSKPGRRGRVDICREKSGRGGKLVTVVRGFTGVSSRELDNWARELRRQCGVGGACKDGQVELQGDHREAARFYFEKQGFRPVLTGG